MGAGLTGTLRLCSVFGRFSRVIHYVTRPGLSCCELSSEVLKPQVTIT